MLLLDYCPPHLRDDLDLNDGFEPHNPDHIAEDPNRSLIFDAATEARKHGFTRAEWLSITLSSGTWYQADEIAAHLDLINDRNELAATIAAIRESMTQIRRTISRVERKRRAA